MNQKGQAMIEILILGFLLMVAFIALIRLGLAVQMNIVIDELIESAHLCELQQKSFCQTRLKDKLADFNLKILSSTFITSADTSFIKLHTESNLGKIFEKESELYLELSIP